MLDGLRHVVGSGITKLYRFSTIGVPLNDSAIEFQDGVLVLCALGTKLCGASFHKAYHLGGISPLSFGHHLIIHRNRNQVFGKLSLILL